MRVYWIICIYQPLRKKETATFTNDKGLMSGLALRTRLPAKLQLSLEWYKYSTYPY